MHKVVLSRFLADRIHKDWIDRLYPQGWTVAKPKTSGRGGTPNGAGGINNTMIASPNFAEKLENA